MILPDVLSLGQEVEAKVVDFDEENKKISLSVKVLLAKDEPAASEEGSSADEATAKEETAEVPAASETASDAEA